MRTVTFQLRRRERSATRNMLGLTITLLLFVSAMHPQLTFAQGDGGQLAGTSPGTQVLKGVLHPAIDNLSSSSWLFTASVDPEAASKLIEQDPMAGWGSPLGPGSASTGSYSSSAIQQVPFRNPAPSMSRNILVTRQVGYQTIQT